MYRIIASDQEEYGPVTAGQICQWIADERINARTMAVAEGGTEWKPLTAFPEFAGALAAAAKTALPVASFAATPPPVPIAAPFAPVAPAGPFAPPAPTKKSGMAIASLILGICGICGITALIGLILGIIAMSKIRKSNGVLGGFGLALAGTIVSALFLLLILLTVVPKTGLVVAVAKHAASTTFSVNNMKQLIFAVNLYSASHDWRLPPAATWCDAIQSYAVSSGASFLDPSADASNRCSYAFNAKLSGLSTAKANPNTVMFFETDGGWNLSGGPELMLKHPRHKSVVPGQTSPTEVFLVAFVDGRVEQVPASGLAALRWNP
jgi:uncharacterized membrane protein